jgi:hypothetical protein
MGRYERIERRKIEYEGKMEKTEKDKKYKGKICKKHKRGRK